MRVLRAAGGALAVVALARPAWLGWDALAAPIAEVRFTGDTGRIAAADLERLAAGLAGRRARETPMESVRAARRLPWVRECSVRLRFPDTLEIAPRGTCRSPRWDEARLVSVRGELFAAHYEGALPRFEGPENTAPEMARAYRAIAAAAAAGWRARSRRCASRRAAPGRRRSPPGSCSTWDATTTRRASRASRALWPSIQADRARRHAHADLRYANGFALGESAPPKPAAKSRRA